jgi:hypothetical protein
VLGASVCWLKGKPEAANKGLRNTRLAMTRTIRWVLGADMAYERGAFKVHCCIALNKTLVYRRLRCRNIYAGNLAKASHLHKK